MSFPKKYRRIEPLIAWLKATPASEARSRCLAQHTSWEYVRQIAYGYKLVGPRRGFAIERITGVGRQLMRPRDYWLVWPDLAAPNDPERVDSST